MSRTETTAMLSKLVEKRLRNQTAFWSSEVNFDRNTPDERRVDYVGFKPWNINGEPVPASVDSDCVAKDEDDAWDYAGEICGYQEDFIDRARDLLEVARKAVNE